MTTLRTLTESQKRGLWALVKAEESESTTVAEACEEEGVSSGHAYRTKEEYPELYEELKQRRANDGLPNGEENGTVSVDMTDSGAFPEADTRVRFSREQVEEAVALYVERQIYSADVETVGVEYDDGDLIVGADFSDG
jgi:hypothetical protein